MKKRLAALVILGILISSIGFTKQGGKMAYLQITLRISEQNRPAAVEVYAKYKQPFLTTIPGAKSKNLLVRAEDVQVLHGFDSKENAERYLKSDLFNKDVVAALKPLLDAEPEVRIYEVM